MGRIGKCPPASLFLKRFAMGRLANNTNYILHPIFMNKEKASSSLEEALNGIDNYLHEIDLSEPLSKAEWIRLYVSVSTTHYLRAKSNILCLKANLKDPNLIHCVKDMDTSLRKILEMYELTTDLLIKKFRDAD